MPPESEGEADRAASDAVRRRGSYGNPPSWLILLSASLVAVGLIGRQRPATTDIGSAPMAARAEPGAAAPKPHSRRQWKDILLGVYRGISDDRILLIAAGVTFYEILALFPGIGAMVSVYGLFADPGRIAAHLSALAGFVPEGAIDVLREQLVRFAQQTKGVLSFGVAIGLIISLWSAKAGIGGLFDALTLVFREKEQRSLVHYYGMTLVFTVGGLVVALLSLGVLIALPIVLDRIADPGATSALLKIGRWPVLFGLVTLALSVTYRYGPSRAAARWCWITYGSTFAAVAWLAGSAAFSWYITNFGTYNKTYGSLGAIIGFMTWLWLSITVVLIGGKLDAGIEHQSSRLPPAT